MRKFGIIKICMAIIFAAVCISCARMDEGTIVRVYQPLVSGMVHTYIEVEFDDKTKSSVVLPDDDAVWNRAKKGGKVKVRKSKDNWVFVDFAE